MGVGGKKLLVNERMFVNYLTTTLFRGSFYISYHFRMGKAHYVQL